MVFTNGGNGKINIVTVPNKKSDVHVISTDIQVPENPGNPFTEGYDGLEQTIIKVLKGAGFALKRYEPIEQAGQMYMKIYYYKPPYTKNPLMDVKVFLGDGRTNPNIKMYRDVWTQIYNQVTQNHVISTDIQVPENPGSPFTEGLDGLINAITDAISRYDCEYEGFSPYLIKGEYGIVVHYSKRPSRQNPQQKIKLVLGVGKSDKLDIPKYQQVWSLVYNEIAKRSREELLKS